MSGQPRLRGSRQCGVWGCSWPWELGGCTLDVQGGRGLAVARVAGVGAGVGQLTAAQLQDTAPTR